MNKFEFDPIKHIYSINGVKIPSATQVIGRVLYPNSLGSLMKRQWNARVNLEVTSTAHLHFTDESSLKQKTYTTLCH